MSEISDLEQLKKQIRTASESDGLDFKKELENSKKGQADLIKDIAAFANYGGGIIIYGVDRTARVGVPEADRPQYDPANFHNKIKDYLSPVPTIQVVEIEDQGKTFPVLFISKEEESVVIVSKQFADDGGKQVVRIGEIYCRQNTQSAVVGNDAVLRKIIDRVVDQKLIRQSGIRDAVIKNVLSAVTKEQEASPLPNQSIDWRQMAKERIGLDQTSPSFLVELSPVGHSTLNPNNLMRAQGLDLQTQAESYPLLGIYNQLCDIFPVADGFVAFSKFGNQDNPWLAASAFNKNGTMTTQFGLIEDALYGKTDTILYSTSVRRFVLIWMHAFKYLEILKSQEQWKIEISVIGLKNRILTFDGFQMPDAKQKICIETKFSDTRNFSVVDNNMGDEIVGTCEKFFRLFGVSTGSDIGTQIEKYLRSTKVQDASIFFPRN